MEKEIILVTGCAGRIGTEIYKRLHKHYTLVGLELPNAPSWPGEQIPVDLASDTSVHTALHQVREKYGPKIASIIHLAAYYSFAEQHSPLYDKVTVQGTRRLLQNLRNFEVEQFLFTSTMLVHAPTEPGHPINEDSPVEPSWDYPLSKVKTEKVIRELRGNMPTVILRIAGVYDDSCHSIPISHQIQRIYEHSLESHLFAGDVHHGAAFVHMDDLIDAIEKAVQKRHALPEETVLLIGEPITMSYDEMQKEISRELFGKEIHTFSVPKWCAKIGAFVQCHIPFKEKPFIRPWMIRLADDHYEMNIHRAQKLLGWIPQHSLEETLPKMIQSLKEDPSHWYQVNHLKGKHAK